MKKVLIYITLTYLISCETEIPMSPNENSKEVFFQQIDIGSDYCYQKYYNFENNSISGENMINDWDIAFSNSEQESNILLNSSKMMKITTINPQSGFKNIEEIINSDTTEWHYDSPSDFNESAFSHFSLNEGYYLVDLGYNCTDEALGFTILQIVEVNPLLYKIKIIRILEGNSLQYSEEIEIEKNNKKPFLFYSIENDSFIEIRPNEWDLLFSKYTAFDVPHPNNTGLILDVYLVTGILQNTHIEVAIDSINLFENISQENIPNYIFESNINTIGYNWKIFDFFTNLYSIDGSKIYIIKNQENYYKLKITGYYNNFGEQGCLNFQTQKL